MTDNIKSPAATLRRKGIRAREPWARPTLRIMGAGGAETGVNSTTDGTNTFS